MARDRLEPEHAWIPLFLEPVPAGFPSPAEGYLEDILSLHDLVVRNPAATYFVRVAGTSMEHAGIQPGDILVVDRSLEPRSGHIVLAVLDGEVTVKRLRLERGRTLLVPECDDGEPIELSDGRELSVWGVVTHVVHALYRHPG
jgi:DNA polymerase V